MPPQSPRAALEPERFAAPKKKRSHRARHPLVIAGNAIFTIVLLLAVVLGVLAYWGNQRYEAAGPLSEDKVVNIPRGLGVRDIAELLTREGVIRDPWIFVAGAAKVQTCVGKLTTRSRAAQSRQAMRSRSRGTDASELCRKIATLK